MASDEIERRFPRRLLLAGAGTAAAAAVTQAVPLAADAAPGTTAWLLGGNASVATDGSNFLGVKNVAPLVFKTTQTANGTPTERMRITPTGQVGVGVTVPAARFDIVSQGTNPTIQAVNSNTSANSPAIKGTCAKGIGVLGTSTSNIGVKGTSKYLGVYGEGDTYGTAGVGNAYGAYGSGPTGVYGSGDTYGVKGDAATYGVYGTGGTGVFGVGNTGVTGGGNNYGVQGTRGGVAGVRGDSVQVGTWGQGNLWGIYGETNNTSGQVYGVFGKTTSPGGFGVFSQGNCHVNGTLSKTAGSFKIDHPLDPDHKWLSHSFVESPDMMNVYNGNVTTGSDGRATVTLPDYFHALNRDFRYQLTVIGEFAQAIVSRKINDGSFEIRTDKPDIEVSWQVTGIRQDDYAKAHPIEVVTGKTGAERGARQFVAPGSKAKLMALGPTAEV